MYRYYICEHVRLFIRRRTRTDMRRPRKRKSHFSTIQNSQAWPKRHQLISSAYPWAANDEDGCVAEHAHIHPRHMHTHVVLVWAMEWIDGWDEMWPIHLMLHSCASGLCMLCTCLASHNTQRQINARNKSRPCWWDNSSLASDWRLNAA